MCARHNARSLARSRTRNGAARHERASELALFYRKGLIALPITDNATINDLRVEGKGQGDESVLLCAMEVDGTVAGGG